MKSFYTSLFNNPLETFEDDVFEFDVLTFFQWTTFDFNALPELLFIALFNYIALFDTPEDDDEEDDMTSEFNLPISGFLSLSGAAIATQNFMGLIPFSTATTTDLLANLFFSFLTLLTIWIELIYRHKSSFFGHFLPNGAPTVIAPFIILIEIVSSLSRIVSLSVRLFANLCAGHSLIEIILKFSFAFLALKFPLTLFFFLPVFIVFVIIILECAVAYLQAYVFGVLLSIYSEELS